MKYKEEYTWRQSAQLYRLLERIWLGRDSFVHKNMAAVSQVTDVTALFNVI